MQNKIFDIIESKLSQKEKIKQLSGFSDEEFSIYKINEQDKGTFYQRTNKMYITPLSTAMFSRQKMVYDFILSKNTSLNELKKTSEAPIDLRAIMEVQGLNNISPYYIKSYIDRYEHLLEKNIRKWSFYIEFDNDNNCDYMQSFFNAILSKNKSHLLSASLMIFSQNKMFRELLKENVSFFMSYFCFKTKEIYRSDFKMFMVWLIKKYPDMLCDDILEYYHKRESSMIIADCAKQSKIIDYYLKKDKENLKKMFQYELTNKIIHGNFSINNNNDFENEILSMYNYLRENDITGYDVLKICRNLKDTFKDSEKNKVVYVAISIIEKKVIKQRINGCGCIGSFKKKRL